MYLKKRKVNGVLYWSIVESYREKDKVKQKIIKSLGTTENAIKFLEKSKEYEQFLTDMEEYFSNKVGEKMQPILKYPGAKWNLSQWIMEHLPPHRTYLEPFFGSGAVLFNKKPSPIETINDMDGNIVNLFKIIREKPEELAALITFTPWSRDEYYNSYETTGESLEDARRFLVRCWQAFGTKTNGKTGWRHSTTKNGPRMPKQWRKIPERIMEVADRLKDVQIENMAAIDLIKKYNNKDVLIYADPPYLLSTRSGKMYKYEMSDSEHEELATLLNNHVGSVVLSGYDNEIYNRILKDWHKEYTNATTEMGKERTEVLWINPVAIDSMPLLL